MAPAANEKRTHTRYVCEGGVEVRKPGSHGFWGTLCDISQGGCYVQTFDPLPVGTAVQFHIRASSYEIHGDGVVESSNPGVGMGIHFASVEENDKVVMHRLLAELHSSEAQQSGEIVVARDTKAKNY